MRGQRSCVLGQAEGREPQVGLLTAPRMLRGLNSWLPQNTEFHPDFKNVAFALASPDSQELSDTVIY